VIGKNTVAAMQSGIFYGYLSLVEGIIDRIRKEVRTDPIVVATIGLASPCT
jgi:type III pantothenate kinase